jgi:hypothetical protein
VLVESAPATPESLPPLRDVSAVLQAHPNWVGNREGYKRQAAQSVAIAQSPEAIEAEAPREYGH